MPQSAHIQCVGAGADFVPSFGDLLDTGEPELIREPLRRWLARGDRAGATYVYEAWLKAGGEPELIRESLLAWLAGNAAAEEASFVYSAWLQATGEPALIRESLLQWLAGNAAAEKASFV